MLNTSRLIKVQQVADITALSHSSIYRLVRADAFPKPIKLSKHAVAWHESEVLAWIAERTAERDGHTASQLDDNQSREVHA